MGIGRGDQRPAVSAAHLLRFVELCADDGGVAPADGEVDGVDGLLAIREYGAQDGGGEVVGGEHVVDGGEERLPHAQPHVRGHAWLASEDSVAAEAKDQRGREERGRGREERGRGREERGR